MSKRSGLALVLIAACGLGLFLWRVLPARDQGAAAEREKTRPEPLMALKGVDPLALTDLAISEALLKRAVRAYGEVGGYQAVFDKQELEADGRWDNEKTFIKFDKPFTIFLGWMEGSEKGRQILYSEGHLDDKMMVRIPGFFNLIPLIPLSPDDPRLQEMERHSIRSAGIGHFLDEFAASFEESKAANRVRILDLREVEVEGEQGTLLDVLFLDPTYDYPRTTVVFSNKHHLPIEVRLYKNQEDLVEFYRYLDVVIDPRQDDESFKEISDGRMFRLYQKVARAPRPS